MNLDEKLIEEVRNYSFLFNLKDPEYKIIKKKDCVWVKIAEKLGSTDEICRKRWKSLRNTYKKHKRNISLPSGSGVDDFKKKKWKYYEMLDFLDDYDCNRMGLESSFNNETVVDLVSISPLESGSEDISTTNNTLSTPTPSETSQIEKHPPFKRAKTRNEGFENFLKGANEAINKITNSSSSPSHSPIQLQFLSLAQKIEQSNISQRNKLIIEQEVYQWVIQRILELETE